MGLSVRVDAFRFYSPGIFRPASSPRRTRAPDPPADLIRLSAFVARCCCRLRVTGRRAAPQKAAAKAASTSTAAQRRRPRPQAGLLGRGVERPQGASGAGPRRGARSRTDAAARCASAAGRDDAALQDRRDRRARSGHPRRGRNHLQSRKRQGALGGECAGQAIDRQHHQGDDDGRVPGGQPGPDAAKSPSSAATSTPPRRPT